MFGKFFGKSGKPTEYKDQPDKDSKEEAKALEHLDLGASLEDRDMAENELEEIQERYSLEWIDTELLQIQNNLLPESANKHLLLYFIKRIKTLFELRKSLIKIAEESNPEKQAANFQALEIKKKLSAVEISSNRINFSKIENLGWISGFLYQHLVDSMMNFQKKMPIKYNEMMSYVERHNQEN